MPKAAVIHEKGGPDVFRYEDVEVGVPGSGEVRLKHTAIGVNFADTYHRGGVSHPWPVGEPPVIVGFEATGEVLELGPGVEGFAVGDKVVYGLPPLGAYSQERTYPVSTLIQKAQNRKRLSKKRSRVDIDDNTKETPSKKQKIDHNFNLNPAPLLIQNDTDMIGLNNVCSVERIILFEATDDRQFLKRKSGAFFAVITHWTKPSWL